MCKLGRHGYVCIWGSHRGKLGPRKIKAHKMEDVLKDAPRERTPRRPRLGRKTAQAQVREGWEWTGNPRQGAWESWKQEKRVPAVTARHTGPVESNGCRQEMGEKGELQMELRTRISCYCKEARAFVVRIGSGQGGTWRYSICGLATSPKTGVGHPGPCYITERVEAVGPVALSRLVQTEGGVNLRGTWAQLREAGSTGMGQ